MKLSDLTLDSLAIVQGIEKSLKQRRRNALAGLVIAGAGICLQVILAVIDHDEYAEDLETLGLLAKNLWKGDFQSAVTALQKPEATAFSADAGRAGRRPATVRRRRGRGVRSPCGVAW